MSVRDQALDHYKTIGQGTDHSVADEDGNPESTYAVLCRQEQGS